MKGVAVTGMGIVSSIGNNLEETLDSLKKAENGIDFPEIFKTSHSHLPVGEIKISDSQFRNLLKISPGQAYTRATMLGVFAIRQILDNTGMKEFSSDTGIISGTSVGGIDYTERYFHDFENDPEKRKFIQTQHPGFSTEMIAAYFGLKDFVSTISTACSSSANAIMMGARMIESGKLKRVIVGGSDCLTKFTLNGFNSLMILSDNKCKPFDEGRDGLNLGEAAAYILLEAEDCIDDKKVIGRVAGYGNANDAFHQTASSENGEGAFLAIFKAMKKAGISPQDIDYINAHGTGTKNNDLSESIAMKRAFGTKIPDFSSTKAFTGHTLGAAGAVEAVFSLLSLQEQEIFPNLNFEKRMDDTALMPVTQPKKKKLNSILSNSFGFGGNCTSLIFQKDE
ncbi:beta-ketoacyl synthase [Gramella sp. KN1008]|uniref:beta-ketoacyl-[acyl-carrier-protein] synthase family protein n=1 Tax=Gramella sp. KN1008 TaxID=2529298 RepID=UPI00103B24A4|nr:beta-ketoacyl-[acyl-carrier-protein] synthase family protein [Gramella sp. KN1008]TBW29262.1 beta-ketoacyl-[acyl-carrier-protein] synthase family protein [Gramella sp. KN1008]